MSPIRHPNGRNIAQDFFAHPKDFLLPAADRFRREVEREVKVHPVAALAVAAVCGVLIGMWIKRR